MSTIILSTTRTAGHRLSFLAGLVEGAGMLAIAVFAAATINVML